MEFDNLHAYVDTLLVILETEPEDTFIVQEDEFVMSALFGDSMPPQDFSHLTRKRQNSERSSYTEEIQRLKNKERQQLEEAQMASILLEEMKQYWVREIGVDP